MTFNEYQQLALRTCNVMDAKVYNSVHMVLGITSEWLETLNAYYDSTNPTSIQDQIKFTENLKKEVGDVLWYTAGLAYFNDLKFDRGNRQEVVFLSIEDSIEKLNSIFKANWIYDRSMIAPDKTGVAPIDQVQTIIYSIIEWAEKSFPFKITDVMKTNIDKLAERFPDKFDAFLANNRKEDIA